MRVAVLTGNLGRFERVVPWVPQDAPAGTTIDIHRFTDATFPPRVNMSPRLQARILKILGWQLVPGYDRYVWVDAQFACAQPDSVAWLLGQLDDHDLVFFRHPSRTTIQQEAAMIRRKMPHSNRLMQRYTGEFLAEQMAVIEASPGFVDDRLYAAGLCAYRPTPQVCSMMLAWWYHVSRYHVNDQLSLPYVAWQAGCDVAQIDGDVFHDPHFLWTRGPGWK